MVKWNNILYSRIYHESDNFACFVTLNALAKVKAGTHFWILVISSMYVSLLADKILPNCEYFNTDLYLFSETIYGLTVE